MKKIFKCALILSLVFSCLISTCFPISALAGLSDVDNEEEKQAISIAIILFFLLFWPIIFIVAIAILINYMITGIILPVGTPTFFQNLCGVFFGYALRISVCLAELI